jgi:hypothetical protein
LGSAPVNACGAAPKSSLSSSGGATAPQFIAMNARSARGLAA